MRVTEFPFWLLQLPFACPLTATASPLERLNYVRVREFPCEMRVAVAVAAEGETRDDD